MDPLRESPQEPVPAHGTRSGSPDSGGAELPWWWRITVPFEVVIASVVGLVYQQELLAAQAG